MLLGYQLTNLLVCKVCTKAIKNCKYQCHDVSGTHHTPHKQHHIHSNNKWCDWKGIPKCNTMANKDKGTNQVKPKGH